ncbi:thioredoxin-disulfide reductase [Buchnera aphidicola (Hormaphis cornu)]|nr:thioredoxin-disulfide reductase [Buchnera aphidicola (Hormaphis cornu)]
MHATKKNFYKKLMILGSGPAGYTASIYAARANLEPTLITGGNIGGQLTTTHAIENWPGEINCLDGFKLMQKFYEHSIKFGTKIIQDEIIKVDLSSIPFVLTGRNQNYITKALIIATGALPRYLGLKSEKFYKGKGVSTCAVCDGFFYKDKTVAVVGGGNSAIEEALYLSKLTMKVYLIHRRTTFKAEQILLSRLSYQVQQNKIILLTNFKIIEIMGDNDEVKNIKIQSTINPKTEKIIDVSGLFIAIGLDPNTSIFTNQLSMHNGYINVYSGIHGNATKTNVEGVFAAGDVIDHVYKQAITAAASGCMAALDASKYLESFTTQS